jgi:hypothetical protein
MIGKSQTQALDNFCNEVAAFNQIGVDQDFKRIVKKLIIDNSKLSRDLIRRDIIKNQNKIFNQISSIYKRTKDIEDREELVTIGAVAYLLSNRIKELRLKDE